MGRKQQSTQLKLSRDKRHGHLYISDASSFDMPRPVEMKRLVIELEGPHLWNRERGGGGGVVRR